MQASDKTVQDFVSDTKELITRLGEIVSKSSNSDDGQPPQPLVNDESREIVWQLNRSFVENPKFAVETVNVLISNKFPELANQIVSTLFDLGPARDEATTKFSLNFLTFLKQCLQTNKTVAASGLVQIAVIFAEYLNTVRFFVEQSETTNNYPQEKWAIVKLVLYCLFHLAKSKPLEIGRLFSSDESVDTLDFLYHMEDSGNHHIKPVAAMLAGIVIERETFRLRFVECFDLLRTALQQTLDDDLIKNDPKWHSFPILDMALCTLTMALKINNVTYPNVKFELAFSTSPSQIGTMLTEFLVGDDPKLEALGLLLLKSFAPNSKLFPKYGRSLFRLATVQGSDSKKVESQADIAIEETRVAKAVSHIGIIDQWLKARHSEEPKEPLVIKGESYLLNEALSTAELAASETKKRVEFLERWAKQQPEERISNEVYTLAEMIADSYVATSFSDAIVGMSMEAGYPRTCLEYFEHYINEGFSDQVPLTFLCCNCFLMAMWNFTDKSPQWRIEFAKAGAIEPLLAYLERSSAIKNKSPTEEYVIFIVINTVSNMSRSIELKVDFLEHKAVEILQPYLDNSTELQKLMVILTLAHVLSDTPEATKLAHEHGVVPTLVRYCKMAMKNKDRTCLLVHKSIQTMTVGYSLEELGEGVLLLAANDDIKQNLIDNGVSEIVDYLLAVEDEPILTNLGIDLLWTLCFLPSVRKALIEGPGDPLGRLRECVKSSKTADVRRNSLKALTFIENWEKKVAAAEELGNNDSQRQSSSGSGDAENGHIFLSYSWKQQETVLRIKQFLNNNGFKMDVDKMHGDLLEAMANAVEKASVVLICFSNSYKQSNPCRSEAQYAHALSKPIVPVNMEYHYFPDGWLGILVRSRKFVDMSLQKRTFETATSMLLSEINILLGMTRTDSKVVLGGGHSTEEAVIETTMTMATKNPGQIVQRIVFTAVTETKFSKWSTAEVKSWLEQMGLVSLADNFTDVDGQLLLVLLNMKVTAPEFYYKTVEKLLSGCTLTQQLKLYGALDRLLTV